MKILVRLVDFLVFIILSPVFILFCLASLFFYFYKTFIRLISKSQLLTKNLGSILGPLDIYFYNLEGNSNFHKRPTKVIPIIVTLSGQLNLETFKNKIEERVILVQKNNKDFIYNRLRQHITSWLGYTFYTNDETFNVSDHLTVLEKEHGVTEENVLLFLEQNIKKPYKPKISPWDLTIIPYYNGEDKTFLLFRFHHTIADGLSVFKMFQDTMMEDGHGVRYCPSVLKPTKKQRRIMSIWNFMLSMIELPRNFIADKKSRAAFQPDLYCQNSFFSLTSPISLDAFKRAKKETGISFRNAINVAISQALTKLMLESHADKIHGDFLRSTISLPLPDHPKSKLVNHFIYPHFDIPISRMPLDERVALCEKNLLQTFSCKLSVSQVWLSRIANSFPSAIYRNIFLPKSNAARGVVISNMPGPPKETFLWDNKMLDIMFFVPASINPWLSLSIISYNNYVKIGFSGGSHVFTNRDSLDNFKEEFTNTLFSVLNRVNV